MARKAEAVGTFSRFVAILALLIGIAALAQAPAGSQGHATAHLRQPTANASASDTSLFQPPVTISSGGGGAISVAVADLNGDRKPDLAVANQSTNTVAVLLGNGDGTFQQPLTYDPGGVYPTSVAVADLDGDDRPDLVVATAGNGDIGVLLGNGDGTFQSAKTYLSGGVEAYAIAVADMNHDGEPDVVVTTISKNGDGAVGVLLGNGDGTFQPVRTDTTGGATGAGVPAVAVADVNGDGKPDVLAATLKWSCSSNQCNTVGAVAVLLGNGDGMLQSAILILSGGVYSSSLTVADVSGDGKPDIVVENLQCCGSANGAVGVLLGNGDGTFQRAVVYQSGVGASGMSVAVADVNRDGNLDIVATDECAGNDCLNQGVVGVLLGNGDGTFQAAQTYSSAGFLPRSVAVTDLNGDGASDIVVANFCGNNRETCERSSLAILLNNGSNQIPTTTILMSSLNASVFGQAVTFKAEVTSNSGTPTGTLQVLNGSTVVGTGTLASGIISIPVSTLPAGTDLVTASYLGGGGFAPSKSTPLTQTVTKATTATALASSPNPAAANQAVTFTAAVSSQYGGAATGTVTFMAGAQSMGSTALSRNVAALTTSFATAGTYSITAQYNGDSNNTGSTSGALSEKIIASTTTMLISSLNPSVVGQAVTFVATVSSSAGAPPNGETITFKNGSTVLGTGMLSSGMASLTTSSLSAGVYTITASYPGDANFAASTSPELRQVVNSTTKSMTATTLVSSLNPSVYGQKVTWTATVTSSGSVTPTGKVRFTWSGYTVGSATLNSSGVATLSRSNLNADPYPLTAVYAGDSDFLGSTSVVLNQVVLQTMTSATVTSSPNPSMQGQSVTFTATISSPTVIPAGPVTFTAGKTILGTAQLGGGKAKLTISSLSLGSTKVTATYYGDSNIAQSSVSVMQTVQ